MRGIAATAGCSAQTVSLVLGGKSHLFQPAMIERVRQAATALGYRPNASAKAVRSGRFGAIGLILSHTRTRSTLPQPLLTALLDRLGASRNLLLQSWPETPFLAGAKLPTLLSQAACDGVLLNYTSPLPQEIRQQLDAGVLPWVLINNPAPDNAVRPADRAAGCAATRDLLAAGHRRIAYVDLLHGPGKVLAGNDHYSIAERYRGYLDAMREAGLEAETVIAPDDGVVAPVDASWLDRSAATAAVFYAPEGSHHAAAAAASRGRSLQVTTFADVPPADPVSGTTTWLVDHDGLAAAALAMLEARITNPGTDLPSRDILFTRFLGALTR